MASILQTKNLNALPWTKFSEFQNVMEGLIKTIPSTLVAENENTYLTIYWQGQWNMIKITNFDMEENIDVID